MSQKKVSPPESITGLFANVIEAYEFSLHWNRESVCELETALCILRVHSPLRFGHVMSVLLHKAYATDHGSLLALDQEGCALIMSGTGFSVIDYKIAA